MIPMAIDPTARPAAWPMESPCEVVDDEPGVGRVPMAAGAVVWPVASFDCPEEFDQGPEDPVIDGFVKSGCIGDC